MNEPPLNLKTKAGLEEYLAHPGQALALIGASGLNKGLIGRKLAADLLDLRADKLSQYPYFMSLGMDNKAITIEDIRAINEFVILKVPNKKAISRVILIVQADNLTTEAQNALLKNLEEPPLKTIFILTARSPKSLLPTIVSRLQLISVYKPDEDKLIEYYQDQGFELTAVKQAYLIADGLPALMGQLLNDDSQPLKQALVSARQLLSSPAMERLVAVNGLAKDKLLVINIFFVIKQMAKFGLNAKDQKNAIRWKNILAATLRSEKQLAANVQLKLVLTDYMLEIS